MTKKYHLELKKAMRIPKGMQFVIFTYELLNSAPFRGASIGCRRLLDFLMLENMEHEGKNNGNLKAPYDQLEAFGIPRNSIKRTITEAEKLGLIEVNWGQRESYNKRYMNTYKLTFLPWTIIGDNGIKYYVEPDNSWRRVTDDDAKIIKGKKPKRRHVN